MPISTEMNHGDPYGAGEDDLDDLPPLPIPRPGEWSPMAATSQPSEQRLAPPALGGGLGGGASFTAAGDGDGDTSLDTSAGLEWSHAERERRDAERFTWEIAARLTAGLLANPGRGNSSVKDAMGLFDQLLQEMNAYTKIASEFEPLSDEASRRRSHEEYFRNRGASSSSTSEHPVPGSSGAPGASAPTPPPSTPKPEPTQPRPMGDYRPIPPGARGPYSPGSMAGTPPPEHQPGDGGEQAA